MQEFKFRGKTLEEIKKMSLEEFSNIITSRERKAFKRGFTEVEKKFIKEMRKDPAKFHKTHCREMIIIPEMVGKRLGIHNGKEFVAIDIKEARLNFISLTKNVEFSLIFFVSLNVQKLLNIKFEIIADSAPNPADKPSRIDSV